VGGATCAGVEGAAGAESAADPEGVLVDALGDFAEVVLDFAAARESVR
jgi:hypothetical protein